MWRSLQILVLASTLAACGQDLGSFQTAQQRAERDAQIRAETIAEVNRERSRPADENSREAQRVPREPIFIDSGVREDYCVDITFDANFREGTTEQQVDDFAESIKQRLCVDGAPRSGSTQGRDTVPATGQDMGWTAVFR